MGLVSIVDQRAIGLSGGTGFSVHGGLGIETGGKRAGIIAIQTGDVGGGTIRTARIRKQRADIDRALLRRARIERHRTTAAGIHRKLKSTQKLLTGLLSVAAGSLHASAQATPNGVRPG